MSDATAVDPAVLRALRDYLNEVEAMGETPEVLDAEDHLIVFCREIYNQFFAGVRVLRLQLGEPGIASRIKVDARRITQGHQWPPHVAAVVHGYLKFCGLWSDLFGLPYQEESIGKLHFGFLPRMLDEFARWGHAERHAELVRSLIELKHRHQAIIEQWRLEQDG